jgi:hypothetical protein
MDLWLSFGSVKARDRLSDLILSGMKSVDWRFDEEIVGYSAGEEVSLVVGAGAGLSLAFGGQVGAGGRKGTMDSSHGSLNEYMRRSMDPAEASQRAVNVGAIGGSVTVIAFCKVGLRNLFTEGWDDFPRNEGLVGIPKMMDRRPSGSMDSGLDEGKLKRENNAMSHWNEYLEGNGRDVCMIKDMKVLRDLYIKTDGIPPKLRGELWFVPIYSGKLEKLY